MENVAYDVFEGYPLLPPNDVWGEAKNPETGLYNNQFPLPRFETVFLKESALIRWVARVQERWEQLVAMDTEETK